MLLKGGKVLLDTFEFEEKNVLVRDGRIAEVTDDISISEEVLDCTDCYIVPGLVDVHTHGCLGYDYTDAGESEIAKMADYQLSRGVTSFLPTLVTSSYETYITAAKKLKNAYDSGSGTKILGIHLEGPYYSPRFKGAQNEKYIRNPSVSEFDKINSASGGLVRLISLAPERENACEFIKAVCGKARVALGHTGADYLQASEAFDAGATQLTHTFNAMPPLHHRNTGVLGAAFERRCVLCECICDGFHLHPSAVRLLFSAVGADRVVLVTDSISAAGLSDGDFTLGGLSVNVSGGRAYLSDKKTIAGSTAKLIDCVRNAIAFGIPAEDAFRAATINAAISAGADGEIGSITVGKCADILVLDKDYNIKKVIINGKCVK